MENREIVSTSKITTEIILQKILWEIVFAIVFVLISNVIKESISMIVLQVIIVFALNILISFITWKVSISAGFAKYTISRDDINIVMRNLIIFTVIECVIYLIANGIFSILLIIAYLAILPLVKKEIMKQIV